MSVETRAVTDEIEWIAHRGYAARYPENTLLALERAVAAGARRVEFDVQLTADGVPVLLHDADLERTARRPQAIADLTVSELAAISVHEPARFGDRFAPQPIAGLAQVVGQLRAAPSVHAYVELKRRALARAGVRPMVERVLAELAPIAERATVISFSPEAVAVARALGAHAVGWVLERWDGAAHRVARELDPDLLFVNHEKVPPGERLWPGRWRWGVYEVVDLALARALVERGASYIETMAVGEMIAAERREAEGDPGAAL